MGYILDDLQVDTRYNLTLGTIGHGQDGKIHLKLIKNAIIDIYCPIAHSSILPFSTLPTVECFLVTWKPSSPESLVSTVREAGALMLMLQQSSAESTAGLGTAQPAFLFFMFFFKSRNSILPLPFTSTKPGTLPGGAGRQLQVCFC